MSEASSIVKPLLDKIKVRTGRKLINLAGKKFGRLWVIEVSEVKKGSHYAWNCMCDCGNAAVVAGIQLRSGKTISCGCYAMETTKASNTRHGMRGVPEYSPWISIKKRCSLETDLAWPKYGGRGIVVCERWQGREGFLNFLYDMGPRPSMGHSVERKDVNGNYEPSNCVWATMKEQQRNRRNTRWVEWNGERKPLVALCEELGKNHAAVNARISRGMSLEQALSKPVRFMKPICRETKKYNKRQKERHEALGIPYVKGQTVISDEAWAEAWKPGSKSALSELQHPSA